MGKKSRKKTNSQKLEKKTNPQQQKKRMSVLMVWEDNKLEESNKWKYLQSDFHEKILNELPHSTEIDIQSFAQYKKEDYKNEQRRQNSAKELVKKLQSKEKEAVPYHLIAYGYGGTITWQALCSSKSQFKMLKSFTTIGTPFLSYGAAFSNILLLLPIFIISLFLYNTKGLATDFLKYTGSLWQDGVFFSWCLLFSLLAIICLIFSFCIVQVISTLIACFSYKNPEQKTIHNYKLRWLNICSPYDETVIREKTKFRNKYRLFFRELLQKKITEPVKKRVLWGSLSSTIKVFLEKLQENNKLGIELKKIAPPEIHGITYPLLPTTANQEIVESAKANLQYLVKRTEKNISNLFNNPQLLEVLEKDENNFSVLTKEFQDTIKDDNLIHGCYLLSAKVRKAITQHIIGVFRQENKSPQEYFSLLFSQEINKNYPKKQKSFSRTIFVFTMTLLLSMVLLLLGDFFYRLHQAKVIPYTPAYQIEYIFKHAPTKDIATAEIKTTLTWIENLVKWSNLLTKTGQMELAEKAKTKAVETINFIESSQDKSEAIKVLVKSLLKIKDVKNAIQSVHNSKTSGYKFTNLVKDLAIEGYIREALSEISKLKKPWQRAYEFIQLAKVIEGEKKAEILKSIRENILNITDPELEIYALLSLAEILPLEEQKQELQKIKNIIDKLKNQRKRSRFFELFVQTCIQVRATEYIMASLPELSLHSEKTILQVLEFFAKNKQLNNIEEVLNRYEVNRRTNIISRWIKDSTFYDIHRQILENFEKESILPFSLQLTLINSLVKTHKENQARTLLAQQKPHLREKKIKSESLIHMVDILLQFSEISQAEGLLQQLEKMDISYSQKALLTILQAKMFSQKKDYKSFEKLLEKMDLKKQTAVIERVFKELITNRKEKKAVLLFNNLSQEKRLKNGKAFIYSLEQKNDKSLSFFVSKNQDIENLFICTRLALEIEKKTLARNSLLKIEKLLENKKTESKIFHFLELAKQWYILQNKVKTQSILEKCKMKINSITDLQKKRELLCEYANILTFIKSPHALDYWKEIQKFSEKTDSSKIHLKIALGMSSLGEFRQARIISEYLASSDKIFTYATVLQQYIQEVN